MPETKLIQLRALEPSDIDLLYDWENRNEYWELSQTRQPFSKHVLKQYLEQQHVDAFQTGQIRLMITLEDVPVGTIELFEIDALHKKAGVGLMVVEEENRRKGIALQSLKEIANYAFTHLQLHQLYCNIIHDNLASIRLFEKAGYIKAGVKKDWLQSHQGYKDVCFYQFINAQ